MSDTEIPRGQLFSRVYLEKGKPQADSKRFRARLAAQLLETNFPRQEVAQLIFREIGVKVRTASATYTIYYYDYFMEESEIRDVLDAITLIYQSIEINYRKVFRQFVERAMREENLSYRLDEEGGVHFYFDEEFERSRASTLAGLSGEQYRAAREAFADAHKALLLADTLGAVRRSFDAVENIFKLRFGVPRLGASEIKSKLGPLLSGGYTGRVGDAAGRLVASLAEWTNAGHQFRHAPGEADPSPPPLDMAVLMVSGAAGHLRWLASLPDAGTPFKPRL